MTGIEKAVERQKNLECFDEEESQMDLVAGCRCEFDDRYIDMIPHKDRKSISIFTYREGKNTAAMRLTVKAAVVLVNGLHNVLKEHFAEQIEKLIAEEDAKNDTVTT